MTNIRIKAGPFSFCAQLQAKTAPNTCRIFLDLLPFRNKIIHVRWSGEAVWIPLGERNLGLTYENATSHPAPGDVIVYPGGISETEILIAYGPVSFSSKVGHLAGNHFMTISQTDEQLRKMGEHVLWHGALDIEFELIP